MIVNPAETHRFTLEKHNGLEDAPTWIARAPTVQEEHEVLDIQKPWGRYLYVLRRCLKGIEGRYQFEAGPLGGANDATLAKIPLDVRGAVADRILGLMSLTEAEVEK